MDVLYHHLLKCPTRLRNLLYAKSRDISRAGRVLGNDEASAAKVPVTAMTLLAPGSSEVSQVRSGQVTKKAGTCFRSLVVGEYCLIISGEWM